MVRAVEERTQRAPFNSAARPSEPPAGLSNEPRRKEQIATLRNLSDPRTAARHTKSIAATCTVTPRSLADGAGDGTFGTPIAMEWTPRGMDFVVLTDHQSGDQEYTWWRTEKASRHVPRARLLHGAVWNRAQPELSERASQPVFTRSAACHILPITPAGATGRVTGPVLYPLPEREQRHRHVAHLRHRHGHRLARQRSGAGADRRDLPGRAHFRRAEGAPLAPSDKRTELWAGGYKPLGFVWNAWAKGYKLGVQASSDHVSTHLVLCLRDRGELARASASDGRDAEAPHLRRHFEHPDGLSNDRRRRHLHPGGRDETKALPELSAKIVGAGPLKKVVIVRDNQYIYSNEPTGDNLRSALSGERVEAGSALLLCAGGAEGRQYGVVVANLDQVPVITTPTSWRSRWGGSAIKPVPARRGRSRAAARFYRRRWFR